MASAIKLNVTHNLGLVLRMQFRIDQQSGLLDTLIRLIIMSSRKHAYIGL